jgi:four helix bundle protein
MFRFEKLHIWKEARHLVKEIYSLTKKFPSEERYCLTNQTRRSAISIALNIAEGSDRKSDIEFKRFLRMALGSDEEVITCLFLALDLGYLDQKEFDKIYQELNQIAAKINALINKLS